MSAHPLPQEKIEAIRKARWAGASQFEISVELDVDQSTVSRYTADIPVQAKPGRRPCLSRQRVAQLLCQGLSVALISERLGVSRAHVFRVCKLKFGCTPSELARSRSRGVTIPHKLKAPAIAKIKAAWIAGASLSDLSAEHDVTEAAILYHVKGLQRQAIPPMGRPRSFDHDRAASLVRQGFKLTEVAERMGVSKSAISQALARKEWKAAA